MDAELEEGGWNWRWVRGLDGDRGMGVELYVMQCQAVPLLGLFEVVSSAGSESEDGRGGSS